MQEATELISLRIPKSMSRDVDYKVKSGGYASRTELVREALREKLYKNALKSLEAMRGALKGKVKVKGTHAQWRRAQWKRALRQAKGSVRGAYEILEKEEKEALKGFRF